MSDYGGRRIMRSISIDISSIKFLTFEEIEKLKKIAPIKDYLNEKVQELETFNNELASGESVTEQRNLTNIGTFRALSLIHI